MKGWKTSCYAIVFIALTSALVGCGGSRSSLSDGYASRALFIPVGVDSTVAMLADSLSQASFVDYDSETQARALGGEALQLIQESDSLWKILEMTRENGKTVTREDSVQSIHAFNEAAVAYQEAAQLQGDNESMLLARQTGLLDLAQEKFEEAITYNPFDEQARALLARVYLLQYTRLKRAGAIDQSITILERLTRLEQGRHELYSELAAAYYSKEDWPQAALNYGKAEAVLFGARETDVNAEVPGALSPDDSALVFNYAYYLGESSAFAYDAAAATVALERARVYASGPTEEDVVDSFIEWMSWDDGNIRASELRDELAALEIDDIAAAEAGYLDLLPMLNTQPARDEITWKLALVEANQGKTEQAVGRLKPIVDRTRRLDDGSSEDPDFARYFDSYGALCYNLASENLRETRNKRNALTYYLQSASIAWENRALAYLEVAKILQNNTQEAIGYAEKGLAANPDDSNKKEIYALLVSLHRRAGNQQEARRYFNMHRALNP